MRGLPREESRRRKEGGSKEACRGNAILKKRGEEHIPGSSLAYTLRCSCDSLARSQINLLPSRSMDFPNCITYPCLAQNERGNRKGMKAHIQTASTILNCLIGVSTSFALNFCTSLGSLESWTAALGDRSFFS